MDAKTRPLAAGLLIAGLLIAGLLGWAGAARGQDLSGYLPDVPGYAASGDTVQSRPRPQYDPIGVRAGSFLVHPRLDLGFGYDSNLFGSSPGRGSWLLGTHASVLAGSNWSRDSLGAFFSVDDLRSPSIPSQGRTDWTGSLGGTLDIGDDRLTLGAAHLFLHQDRTAIDALPTDQPVAYQVNDIRASYVHTFNRLSLTPNLELSSYRFDPTTILGVPAPQAYRDRDVAQVGVTGSYDLSPLHKILVVLRDLDSHYTAPQPGAPSRDSTGVLALGGIDYGGTIWNFRLLAGWEQRDFAAPQYRAHGAPVAEADVVWSPSGVTAVTGTLARTIEDAAQEGVAGYTYTVARLAIDHEYLRNVLLHGAASVQHADFLQGGGVQTSYTLDAGVTWLMNRRMRLSATEAFTDLHSTAGQSAPSNGGYVRNVMLVTLGFGL